MFTQHAEHEFVMNYLFLSSEMFRTHSHVHAYKNSRLGEQQQLFDHS